MRVPIRVEIFSIPTKFGQILFEPGSRGRHVSTNDGRITSTRVYIYKRMDGSPSKTGQRTGKATNFGRCGSEKQKRLERTLENETGRVFVVMN